MNTYRILTCTLLVALSVGCDGSDDGQSGTGSDAQTATPGADMASALPDANTGSSDAESPQHDASVPSDALTDCECEGRQSCVDDVCTEPEICMGHEDCLGERICESGRCIAGCREDGDCPRALGCDTESRRCIEVSPCTVTGHCLDGRLCINDECTDPCTADSDCQGRQTCDAESGLCREAVGCEGDEDCIGDAACRDGECVAGCMENADCQGAQSCIEGQCAEPAVCTQDQDCRSNRLCQAGQCEDPCEVGGCPGEQICNGGRCLEANPCVSNDGCFDDRRCIAGLCEDPCREAADCAGAQRCTDGACTEPEQCARDVDCLENRVCQSGTCEAPCTEVGCPDELFCVEDDGPDLGRCTDVSPCRRDTQCVGDRYCAEGRCEDPCLDPADCRGALQCREGRCVEPDRCFDDGQCQGERICFDLHCTDRCDEDVPCRGTQVCDDGVCVEGDGCAADRDCLAGRRCHRDALVCVDACEPGGCLGGRVCGDEGYCVEAAGCGGDLDCIGDRRCLLSECRTVRCEGHEDCPGAERCLNWACVADVPGVCDCGANAECIDGHCQLPGPCADDAACVQGLCMADGRCSECSENADCPGATRCMAGFCSEAPECIGDAGCLSGRVCMPAGFCAADIDCRDDGFEGNDIPEAATPIGLMAMQGLRLCDGIDDWYRFATEGQVLVTARYDNTARPLELAVYNIDGSRDALETSSGTSRDAWVAARSPGEYLLRVRRVPGGPLVYDLELNETVGCIDDAQERPWRNDGPETASTLDLGVTLGTLCGDDDADFFHYSGEQASSLGIEGDVVLLSVDGGNLVDRIEPRTMFRVQGDSGTTYRLNIERVREPGRRCNEAPVLEFGQRTPFDVPMDGSDDFAPECFGSAGADGVFRVNFDEPGSLRIDLDSDNPMVPIAVYAECGDEPIACGFGIDGFQVDALIPGVYHVVLGTPSAGSIVVTSPRLLACEEYPLATIGRSAPVFGIDEQRRFSGGCNAGGPIAVRRVRLNTPQRLEISAESDDQIVVGVRSTCDDSDTEVGCDQGFSPVLETDILPAGDWYVLVETPGQADLTVRVGDGVAEGGTTDACPDNASPLASGDVLQASGSLEDAGSDYDLGACGLNGGGADHFLAFQLEQQSQVNIQLTPEDFSGVVAVLGAECDGGAICGQGDGTTIDTLLPAGIHVVVIQGATPDDIGRFVVEVSVR